MVLDTPNMVQTYYDVHFLPRKTGIDENTTNLPQVAGDWRNCVYIVWPFQADVLSQFAQDVILTTCLRYRETEQVLNEDKLGGGNRVERKP